MPLSSHIMRVNSCRFSSPVQYNPVQSNTIQSSSVQSSPVQSSPVQSSPVQSNSRAAAEANIDGEFGLEDFTYNNTSILKVLSHHFNHTDFLGITVRQAQLYYSCITTIVPTQILLSLYPISTVYLNASYINLSFCSELLVAICTSVV